MSDPQFRDGAGRSRTAYRGRLILLITFPVLLLGGSYFLLVEYLFAQSGAEIPPSLPVLRMGGGVLIGLAVILALCSGFVAVGRMARPVRVLLRLVEEGDLPARVGNFLYRSDWDAFYLYKRLQGMLQQSQAGAIARNELESVNSSLSTLKADLEGGREHGLTVPMGEGTIGLVAEIAQALQAEQAERTRFFADLRTRTEALRAQVEGLRATSSPGAAASPSPLRIRPEPPRAHTEVKDPLGNGGAAPGAGNGVHGPAAEPWTAGSSAEDVSAVEEAAERLQQLGSVLALEMERVSPDPAGLGVRYQRFAEALEALELALDSVSSMKATVEQVDNVDEVEGPDAPAAALRWDHLEESLGILEQRLDEVGNR